MKRIIYTFLLPCFTTLFLASCNKGSEKHNGYTFVDLGLSVKWATYNIGANSPENSGDYYAWGETEFKDIYTWDNYKYISKGSNNDDDILCSKYNSPKDPNDVNSLHILEQEDDIAQLIIGEGCRMPTHAEWKELMCYCIWEWKYFNGIQGYKITSDIPGYRDRSIFLPITGEKRKGDVKKAMEGSYWSSENDGANNALLLSFDPYRVNTKIIDDNRYIGRPIRAVCPSKEWSIHISDYPIYQTIEVDNSIALGVYDNHGNGIVENDFFINWSTDEPSIATIMDDGTVTGITPGIATITATTYNYKTTHKIEIIPSKSEYKQENGHDYVDLGLSVNWATRNLGASRSWEAGEVYAWGELSTKTNYAEDNYKFFNGYINNEERPRRPRITKYSNDDYWGIFDNKESLDIEDDVAHLKWGGDWRIPTDKEWEELFWCTKIRKMNINGFLAFKLTSLKPGYKDRYIIIPSDIPYKDHEKHYAEIKYWTNSIDGAYEAKAAVFLPDDDEDKRDYLLLINAKARYRGLFIRPVCKW